MRDFYCFSTGHRRRAYHGRDERRRNGKRNSESVSNFTGNDGMEMRAVVGYRSGGHVIDRKFEKRYADVDDGFDRKEDAWIHEKRFF